MFEYTVPDITYEDTTPKSAYEYTIDISQIEKPIRIIAEEHLATYSSEELNQNWRLHEFFESMIVINLDTATERLKTFTEETLSIGIPSFERFKAVDGSKDVPPSIWHKFYLNRCNVDLSTEVGQKIFTRIRKREAGTFLSCLGVYQKIKNAFDAALKNLHEAEESQDESKITEAKALVARSSRVLIFEDDAAFGFLQDRVATKEGVGEYLNKALAQVPDDWDILYLFVYPTEPTAQISENIQQIFGSWCLPAYVIRHTIYDDLVKEFEKINDPEVSKLATNDLTFSAFQRTRKTYALAPAVVYAAGGESTITGEVFAPFQAVSEFSTVNVMGIPKPGYPPVVKTVYELQE
ncbi:MAG: hypothetical protein WCG42_01335 [Parachlamydiaceae bacterium]